MSVLTRYIVKEILKGSVVALLVLLTLFNLFTFSDELKDIGIGHYGLKEIFSYLALTSPTVFYELVPSAALLGSLFVVGSMANNREIVAMRAAGLSIFWIIKSVMWAGVVLVIIAVLVGEFVAPEAARSARLLKSKAQHGEVVMSSEYGLWLKDSNKFINVRKILGKNVLADIYSYEVDSNNHLLSMSQAGQATYLGNKLWRTEDIKQTKVFEDQVIAHAVRQTDWQSSIDPDLLKVVVVKPDNMSLFDLYAYINFLKKNTLKTQSFELAFWSRLINPLVTFVMLMVSIPFVVGVNRGVSTWGRMMTGIIIGMTFNIFDKIAGHVGLVYGFNPVLMAVLPSLLVFFGAVFAVSKVK